MGGLSDEEAGDEDAAMLDDGAIDAPSGKTKKEREEELRRMMEADGNTHRLSGRAHHQLTGIVDEDMDDAPAETQESAPATDKDESQAKESPEPAETVTVSDGRRRGRRRVMKKKTVKDEEGYLGLSLFFHVQLIVLLMLSAVTREEAAWESFSEDEPAAKKPKVSLSAAAAAAAKGKKTAANSKPGQGNIMSFFKKA